MGTALCAAAALTVATAVPAEAAVGRRYVSTNFPDGSIGYMSWKADCHSGLAAFAPQWQGYMKETGPSKVKSLNMEYVLYREGTGYDTIKFNGTSYVKDMSYGTYAKSVSTDADSGLSGAIKTTRQRSQSGDYVMVIKFRWGRGLLHKDTEFKQAVAFCSATDGFHTGH